MWASTGLCGGCWEVLVTNGPGDGDTNNQDGGPKDLVDSDGNPGTAGWRWESPVPQGNHLRALWGMPGSGSGEDQLFLGGESGALVVGGTTGWNVQRSPGGSRAVLGLSGQIQNGKPIVVGVGIYDLGVVYSGGGWSDRSPLLGTGDGQITSIWASPKNDEFFAVGTTGRVFQVVRGSNSLQFKAEATGVTADSLFAVSGGPGTTAPDVYAVGSNGRVLHRGSDGKWSIEANGLVGQQLNAVWVGQGALAGEVYAAGEQGVVLRKAAGNWSVERPPTTVPLMALWGGGDELYAAGSKGTLLRRKAGVWQIEAQGLSGELLTALWGVSRAGTNTVYAVGNLGLVLRRERDTWQQISSSVTQGALSAVWAASPNEMYAVGSGGLIFKRSGVGSQGSWRSLASPSSTSLMAVHGFSPGSGEPDVWAVGAEGTILHQAGSVWVQEAPYLTVNVLTGVWVGADAVFVTGRGGRVYSKIQGKWDIESGPVGAPLTDDLSAVWGTGSGDDRVIYVAGNKGVVARKDRSGWTREATGLTADTLVTLLGRGEEGLTALGHKGAVLRRQAGKWVLSTARPISQTSSVAVSGCTVAKTGELWAVGTQGALMTSTVGEWSGVTSLTNQPFSGIGCAAPDDLLIVGPSGLVLHKY